MDLILASSSPQRKRILEQFGIRFKAVPADIDEHHSGYRRPHAIVKSIALRKAKAVAKKFPQSWVVGCDTIVILKNKEIATKPKDRHDARQILRNYKGSHSDIYSGLAFVHHDRNEIIVDFKRTRVYFYEFSEQSLEDYLDSGDWKGRSGAMTIEGSGHWTRKIEGEYWNIVGLPVDLLKKYLKKLHLI
jgi:septum formation protein